MKGRRQRVCQDHHLKRRIERYGEGASFGAEDIAAALIISDEFDAAVDDRHFHARRAEQADGNILCGGDQPAPEARGLALRGDAEQAEIGGAVLLVRHLHAADRDGVDAGAQQPVLRAVQDSGQRGQVRPRPGEQIGFEGPARARRIAAIGSLDHGVDLGQVGGGGVAEIHGGALVELRGRGQSSRR